MRTLERINNREHSDTNLYKLHLDKEVYFVKEYLNTKALEQRSNLERDRLLKWACNCYRVPKIHNIFIPELGNSNYLVMDYIDGKTLSEVFASSSHENILEYIHQLYSETFARHQTALKLNDDLLLHPDPNLNNFIVFKSDIFYIDFDYQHNRTTNLRGCLASETVALTIHLINATDKKYKDLILSKMALIFAKDPYLCDNIIGYTLGKKQIWLNALSTLMKKKVASRKNIGLLFQRELKKLKKN